MLNTVAIYKLLQLPYVMCAVCPAVLVMELPTRNPWRPEGAALVHRTVPSRTRRSQARGQGGASSGAIALSGREQEAAAHALPRLESRLWGRVPGAAGSQPEERIGKVLQVEGAFF